jgi:hypothetical protein
LGERERSIFGPGVPSNFDRDGVRFTLDIVAKVENRTTLKISRKLMFRRFYRCNAR